MEIRKLQTAQEWQESSRLAATAFLHPWNEQHGETETGTEECWGCFHESGKMMACIVTESKHLTFDGKIIPASEAKAVVSLPEFRGNGNVRNLMDIVLHEFKKRGDLFALLIPFSLDFYRKYGFELISKNLEQTADIEQFSGFSCRCAVRQADCAEDVSVMKKLYEDFITSKNMVSLKSEADWEYRGNSEFGKRGWMEEDRRTYTYIFSNGEPNAYLQFIFLPGPDGPFIGTMKVTKLIYDSPEAFRNVLGFIYGMRAKLTDICFTLMTPIDLALLLPECNKIERKLKGDTMARVLDVEGILLIRQYPQEPGHFSIRIEDMFLPENTGTYQVAYQNRQAVSVRKTNGTADIEVTETTFCQLAIGFINLSEALYKEGTKINGNQVTLECIFIKRLVCV